MTTKEIFDLILSIAGLVVAILGLVLGVSITHRLNSKSQPTAKSSAFTNSPVDTSGSGNSLVAGQSGQTVSGNGNMTNCTLNLGALTDNQVKELVREASERCANSVTAIIQTALQKVGTGENHPISEEWFDHFCSDAKGASDQQMQNLWSELLAGQIKQPGRFSFKAMDVLASMSSQDAKDFLTITPYIFNNELVFSRGLVKKERKDDFFINLAEMGLFCTPGWINEEFRIDRRPDSFTLKNGNYNVILTNRTNSVKEITVSCYVLTRAGMEIASLSTLHGNEVIAQDAVDCILKEDTQKDFVVEIKQILETEAPKPMK